MRARRKLGRCLRAVEAARPCRVTGGTLAAELPRRWRDVLVAALRLAPEYPPDAWAFAFEGVTGSIVRASRQYPELVADLATWFVRFAPGQWSRKARRRAAMLAAATKVGALAGGGAT